MSNLKYVEPGAPLSQTEFNIAYLYSQGLVKKQIAGRLGLSLETVKNSIRCVYKKLSIDCVTDLTKWMEQEGA